jgi:L-ascorbate metabolism protein UlaG (beta-lactamase superfamily)
VLGLGAAWLARALADRPRLDAWAELRLPPDDAAAGPGVRVTFLGVSTVLVTDGETALLTDGFFTRPGLLRTVLGRVAPDPERIARTLARAGATRLAAVVVVHSHYDHALDAPEVARQTGALLVGSASTANVGRGWGLPEDRLRVPRSGEALRFGAFEVTLVASRHFPHGMAMGEITSPLVPPARATAYREGGSFSVLIAHPRGRLLVQGSAGWIPDALREERADVVLLGVGALGTKDTPYMEAYYREVVEAVGARLVVPIHWDDFTRPLDEPLVPMPRLVDDFDMVLRFLVARTAAAHVTLALLPAWQPRRLF